MGVAHTFRVDSDTARVLLLSTPAGLERMVRDGSVTATRRRCRQWDATTFTGQLEGIFRAHGQVNVGPPLARTTERAPDLLTAPDHRDRRASHATGLGSTATG